MPERSILLQDKLRRGIDLLTKAGIDTPGLDARLLVAAALDCDRTGLLTQGERPLTQEEEQKIDSLLARRTNREPVGRILGVREFWGLPFCLNEATLEPRPDSETLIETALGLPLPSRAQILDLGTGTGCLLLAVLHEKEEATGLGLDQAPRAIEAARANAAFLGLAPRAHFREGGWDRTALLGLREEECFDLILSNPPYIPAADIPSLAPEVRLFDPLLALEGGADGLDPYKTLIPLLRKTLTPQGWALFEVGQGQAQDVAALFNENGFQEIEIRKDLGGVERCVKARA